MHDLHRDHSPLKKSEQAQAAALGDAPELGPIQVPVTIKHVRGRPACAKEKVWVTIRHVKQATARFSRQ